MSDALDPNTPVIIGVGEASDRLGTDGYEALSAVGLAARAAEVAIRDTGVASDQVAAAIDVVGGIRQFETSAPGADAPLGRSNNYPRSVANRVGANPARAVLDVGGGQSSQHLITELAEDIATGRHRVALVFGSEAISTTRAAMSAENRPDFSETVDGDLEDRGFGLEGLLSEELTRHGVMSAPAQYALLENARRARTGLTREQYAAQIGALFEPFTAVAATNPHAAAPTPRTADELMTVTEANRMIADPYPRYVVARDQVNQGAAVLIASVQAARELGVPENRWVFIHGHADLRERPVLDRADLSASPAARAAAAAALEMAALHPDDVATWDFYSCFAIPVFNAAVDGLGLDPNDPRGLTLTGGLPFFGGAGNNYSMHAVAATVNACREHPGAPGFVGANGGIMSKYSAAVYSTTPREWQADRSVVLQAEIDAAPAIAQTTSPDGPATLETFTVVPDRQGRQVATIIGRLNNTGERFVARSTDESVLIVLAGNTPFGSPIHVSAGSDGNLATMSEV